jgi:hypothetical protein
MTVLRDRDSMQREIDELVLENYKLRRRVAMLEGANASVVLGGGTFAIKPAAGTPIVVTSATDMVDTDRTVYAR